MKEGHKYKVGDAIDLGIIKHIWEDPDYDSRLILLLENTTMRAGTFSICTIPKEGITGPVLERFIPASILRDISKLMETQPTADNVIPTPTSPNRTMKRKPRHNAKKTETA